MFVNPIDGGYVISRYTNAGEVISFFVSYGDAEVLVEKLEHYVQDRMRMIDGRQDMWDENRERHDVTE